MREVAAFAQAFLLGPSSALSVHPLLEYQPVAGYSAGRDIAGESEPSTGTKLDIAATDQIRPSATTIPTIHAPICIPSP
jgi:hypothetical protein